MVHRSRTLPVKPRLMEAEQVARRRAPRLLEAAQQVARRRAPRLVEVAEQVRRRRAVRQLEGAEEMARRRELAEQVARRRERLLSVEYPRMVECDRHVQQAPSRTLFCEENALLLSIFVWMCSFWEFAFWFVVVWFIR
jgi:hypothetical protein